MEGQGIKLKVNN